MKVLFINCVYPDGSTGKLVHSISDFLVNNGDESIVIYGAGKKVSAPNVIKATPEIVRKIQSLCAKVSGYHYGGCFWGTKNILRIIKEEKPDVVHLHCINAYMVNVYKLLNYLKIEKIPTVLTLHAEFMFTGHCNHALDCQKWITGCHDCNEFVHKKFMDKTAEEWKLMKKSYEGFEKIVICPVSKWLENRVNKSPFFCPRQICTVLNGIDTNTYRYIDSTNIDINNYVSKKIVLHVTPNFDAPIKGGKHVLEMANRFKNNSNIIFIIVGKHSELYKDLPPNIVFYGHTKNESELAELYSISDITLLTSQRETFSMVCAESLCCGTPVIGFEAGGPESIAIAEFSEFVEQGDDNKLEQVISTWIGREYNKSEIMKCAHAKYGNRKMCEDYYSIYQRIKR